MINPITKNKTFVKQTDQNNCFDVWHLASHSVNKEVVGKQPPLIPIENIGIE